MLNGRGGSSSSAKAMHSDTQTQGGKSKPGKKKKTCIFSFPEPIGEIGDNQLKFFEVQEHLAGVLNKTIGVIRGSKIEGKNG